MAEEQRREIEVERTIPIRIVGAEEIPMSYVNYVFVSHTTDEFFMTFAQIHPPYLLAPTKEEVGQLTHIPAKVVARIALTPSKMKELIDALNENYKKFIGKEAQK